MGFPFLGIPNIFMYFLYIRCLFNEYTKMFIQKISQRIYKNVYLFIQRIYKKYHKTHCSTLQHTAAHCNTLQHTTVNAPACLFNEYTTACHNGLGKSIFLREKTTENGYPIFGIPKNGKPIFLREKTTE